MKLSHQLTTTRTLASVALAGFVSFCTASAEAQFPNLKGIKLPNFQGSSSSRAAQYLPQVIEAAGALQQLQQQNRNRQQYQPAPQAPTQPPQVCPQPVSPPANQPPASPPAVSANMPETKVSLARSLVPRAKQSFAAQDYDRAISTLTEVLKLVPEDADAYQFRSLAYFSKGDFENAAADSYDAFRFGNAWTWDTLRSIYPQGKTSRYTQQLRKLEDVNRSEEQSMSSHFLLAYHYIVLGHLSHAEKQLKDVLAVNADEELSKRLLGVVQNAQEQKNVSQK